MERSINSLKGYDQVDVNVEESKAYRRQTLKRFAIIAACTLLLLLIAVVAFLGTRVGNDDNDYNGGLNSPHSVSAATSIKAVCDATRYSESCISSLSTMNSSSKWDPEELFRLSLTAAAEELRRISSVPSALMSRANGDKLVQDALQSCGELFDQAAEMMNRSIEAMKEPGADGKILSQKKVDDLRTWLSGALTDHETCLDGLEEANSVELRSLMLAAIKNSTEMTSNSLAIATKIVPILQKLGLSVHRRLLWAEAQKLPSLVPAKGQTYYRRLLQTDVATDLPEDVVVAEDGSGKFSTVGEAVPALPE